ncbi:hypothetical protein [Aeromicrobium piscarium]|uniref:HIRAN domain-containing protein n=1 Tax=Aeromicrobium piscarium TaxID=2590901 RepID=A0A554RX57_9ACTN|nr:hypothetical protein [Aeromicrobium piscarium]TSD58677.1 hypothetical protein FNM00_13540 [Aeromicrobium piscarium]
MPSAVLAPDSASGQAVDRTRRLLVLWQHPDRTIYPIGQLTFDGELYGFDYSVAATRIDGFRPLPGLPDLLEHRESPRLFSVFEQRVMARTRPDFATYARGMGLEPEDATPWEQITASGGRRAGDTLQLMEIPYVADGRVHAHFLVSGARHVEGSGRSIVLEDRTVTSDEHVYRRVMASLREHERPAVELVAEHHNSKDPHACVVMSEGVVLGWVPRFLARGVRELLQHGPVTARATRVGSVEGLPHTRLVLMLDHPAPYGFSFDPDGEWAAANSRLQ